MIPIGQFGSGKNACAEKDVGDERTTGKCHDERWVVSNIAHQGEIVAPPKAVATFAEAATTAVSKEAATTARAASADVESDSEEWPEETLPPLTTNNSPTSPHI